MKHYLYLNWKSLKLALIKIVGQPFASLLTLLMLSLALALPLSLYLTVSSVQDWVGRLSAKPQVTLFMEHSSKEIDLAAITSTLQNHQKIKSHSFVSKRQALEDMERRNGLPGLADGLEENPLPDAFIVTPQTLDPGELEILKKELSGLPMVAQAQFDAAWAKRLYGIIEIGKHLTWFLGIALGLALVLVTNNAIRMQILARHQEIAVSKLIGAPDNFIRRPFMYHGMWQGVMTGLAAWALTMWLTSVANPVIREFAQLYGEHVELRNLKPFELVIAIVISVLLAMLGAYIASNHYLRRIEPT